MKQAHSGRAATLLLPVLLAAPMLLTVACGGPSSTQGQGGIDAGRAELQTISLGRLVDVYAYQRIDTTRGDRRDQLNRRSVLVAKDVVVRSNLGSDSLFDPAGEESPTANYQFLPFDVTTGHDELLILWDNRNDEAANFQDALDRARSGLTEIPSSVRGQDTSSRPIPVVPRDAALVLQFSSDLRLDASFFDINPSAVQLLEFAGDPRVVQPADAFRSVPFRIVVNGSQLILDPTILGGEARGDFLSSGLPESGDNATANIRIAIPSRGGASSAFFVAKDAAAELNDLDSNGRDSVVRDFRSGNALDGTAGVLRDLESPVIVGRVSMGITNVAADGTVTVNKRLNQLGHPLYIRGRFPFVGGALSPSTGFALGPSTVPTSRPLRSGDFLEQTVTVVMPDGSDEAVRIRAEILQNLDIGTIRGDSNFAGVGLDAAGTQGDGPTARLRLGPIRGTDSLGRPVGFAASTLPLGEDCELKRFYYEHIAFTAGGQIITDAPFRHDFLRIDPRPSLTGGAGVDPNASVSIEFSEPMDLLRVDPTKNIVLTNFTMTGTTFVADLDNAKTVSAGVVPTRWSDQSGDGTILQLQPPKGFYHRVNATNDVYWFHLLLGASGLADLAGNPVDIANDDVTQVVANWSAQMTILPSAFDNLVGWHTYPFESPDEDGTPFGSIDLFGQYQLLDGRLSAAQTVRFSRTADDKNLGSISRTNRGECPLGGPFNPPSGGALYWQPRMVDVVAPPNVPNPYPDFQTVSQPVGQVIEPHQLRGSRMMMRYLEDDFSLSPRQASDFSIDVEQLYWSPFADFDVLFDVFDRYTMALAHADKRPDLHWTFVPGLNPVCQLDCPSVLSGLSTTFADNVLQGSSPVTVFEDKVYRIDPANMFRSDLQVKYIAYPRFDRTYTWRDSRLVSIDANGVAVGLGGARNPEPAAPTLTSDWTTDVDSPWVPSATTATPSGLFYLDNGDFRGNRRRDHDPIAMPLLVDFKMFPDGPANNLAVGSNGFQVAMLGPPSAFSGAPPSPGGYYNLVGPGCPQGSWPFVRVHTTGGVDTTTRLPVLVDPANTPVALGGVVKDAGAIIMAPGSAVATSDALVRVGPGDGMMNWARADFVRKVSTVTFPFFDTMQPNRRAPGVGVLSPNGYPDFTDGGTGVLGPVRISDFTSLLDPPLSKQPSGTSIVLEIRCAESFERSEELYDPTLFAPFNTAPNAPVENVANRGNLLNPNFACEAFRYTQPNSGVSFTDPRVAITGLTKYVTEDRLSTIANPLTGLLPRYMNFRLVMTNNITQTPAISPSLRSMTVVYRMRAQN